METLQTDLLLYVTSSLDIKETLNFFGVCGRHHQITKLRKFWLSILQKFWHDIDLNTVVDEKVRDVTINAYKDYRKGTHLTLYDGQVPYEAVKYVINVRSIRTSHPDLVVLTKGPRN